MRPHRAVPILERRAGGGPHPVLYDAQDEAVEDTKNRRLVCRVAQQIRLDRGGPDGEVVRVTLHDRDGRVLFEGEVC